MKTGIYPLIFALLLHLNANAGPLVVIEGPIQLLNYKGNHTYTLNHKVLDQLQKTAPDQFSTLLFTSGDELNFVFKKNLLFTPNLVLSSSSNLKYDMSNIALSYTIYYNGTRPIGHLVVSENSIELKYTINEKSFIIQKTKDNFFTQSQIMPIPIKELACHVSDSNFKPRKNKHTILKSNEIVTLRLCIEVDHALFNDNNANMSTTMNWVSELYNQVALIYAVHNIQLQISEIRIWDEPDPYMNINGTDNILSRFAELTQDNFNGDVAQLLTSRTIGGGLAYLDKLCQPYNTEDKTGPYSLAGNMDIGDIYSTGYSFSTFMAAHELGHVLGSPHTHACAWGPNQDSALDNCFATEGGCPKGPEPVNGGSIMSYCFLKANIGINFSNGFGEEPGALIYSNIYYAGCNLQCSVGSTCDDGDSCTTNDQLDMNCNCVGVLIDLNQNDICDRLEPCEYIVNADSVSSSVTFILAREMITSSSVTFNNNIFSSGNIIELHEGFEVPLRTTFNAYNAGCEN